MEMLSTALYHIIAGRSAIDDVVIDASKERMIAWLTETADAGDPVAQFFVGLVWINGFGSANSKFLARRYWEKSAASGYAPSKRALAKLNDTN
jgi:TPR repeat protein